MEQKACINLGAPQVPTAQMSGWQAKVEVGTGSEESLLWGSNPHFPDLLCALGARHFTSLSIFLSDTSDPARVWQVPERYSEYENAQCTVGTC